MLEDSQQIVLQTILSHSFLNGMQIELLEKQVENITGNDITFSSTVAAINKELTEFDLEIKRTFTIDKEVVWVIINRNGDEFAQMASEYTPVEIAEIKKLVCLSLKFRWSSL